MPRNPHKKIFSLMILTAVFLRVNFFAQGAAGSSLTLETVCAGLAANVNTTGEFTQTKTISAGGRQLKSMGKFIFCPLGIMWRTEKPFPSALILTPSDMIQVSGNGSRSVMSGQDNQIFANISQTLSSVFSGNAGELKKRFDCDFSAGADGAWSVTLVPKDATIASVMTSLTLRGRSSSSRTSLAFLEMTETSGNKIGYEFTDQKYPEELSANEKQNFFAD